MTTSLRTALLVLVAVSLVACKKERSAEAPASTMAFEWKQLSTDGKIEVNQRRDGARNECTVQVVSVADKRALWSSRTCLPTPSGLVFISKGGDKLLVFDLFPGAAVQSPDWSQVSLAQLWNKGVVVRQYKGSEILAADRAADMRRSLSWLRGETDVEVKGAARFVNGETQISADLVDGRTITFGFEGAPLPTPPAVSAPPRTAEPAPEPASAAQPEPAVSPIPARTTEPGGLNDHELYTWVDERGAHVFGYGGEVPARFRKGARPVQGTVGVVPNETPTPLNGVGEPVPQPAQPAAAGAQQQPAPAAGGAQQQPQPPASPLR